MKIQKFNENTNNKKYQICMIIDINNNIVDHCNIFENKQDMNNWILNLVNSDSNIMEDIDEDDVGVELNDDDEPIFIDVKEAINFFENHFEVNFHYSVSDIKTNIKVQYGVEVFQNTNKYNL